MAQTAKNIEVMKQPETPAAPRLIPPADIFRRAEQLYQQIARRAFEIFQDNKTFGRDLENWLKAESEFLHPVHIHVEDSEKDLTVRAEVPGFAAQELEVSLEPRRLTITGKRETKEERKEKKTVYTECLSDQLLRVVSLPADVDAERAQATLKDGVLELRMPKAASAKKVSVSVAQT
jgi:HSP20 family protein